MENYLIFHCEQLQFSLSLSLQFKEKPIKDISLIRAQPSSPLPSPAMIGAAASLIPALPRPLPLRSKTAAQPLPITSWPPAALRPSPPLICRARRTIRYGREDDEEEEHGHNPDLSLVESFSVSARGQAFLLRASVDGEEETVLVFRVRDFLGSVTSQSRHTALKSQP